MELQLGLGLPNNNTTYEQFHGHGESRGNLDGQRRRGCGERRQRRGRAEEVENECGRSLRSNYVKVTMDGMGIGRKVDLSVHFSYDSLLETLIDMFDLQYMCDMSVSCFRLVYQDNEGDWLCAEDEPWEYDFFDYLELRPICITFEVDPNLSAGLSKLNENHTPRIDVQP